MHEPGPFHKAVFNDKVRGSCLDSYLCPRFCRLFRKGPVKNLPFEDIADFPAGDFFCHFYQCTVRRVNSGAFQVGTDPLFVNFHVIFEVYLARTLGAAYRVPDFLALFNQKYVKSLFCRSFRGNGARRASSDHYDIVPVFHFITSIAPTGQIRSHVPHEMHILSSTSNQVSTSSSAPLGQTPTQVPQYPHLYLFTFMLTNSPVIFDGKLR